MFSIFVLDWKVLTLAPFRLTTQVASIQMARTFRWWRVYKGRDFSLFLTPEIGHQNFIIAFQLSSSNNTVPTSAPRDPIEMDADLVKSDETNLRRWFQWHEPGTPKEEKWLIFKLDFFILLYTCLVWQPLIVFHCWTSDANMTRTDLFCQISGTLICPTHYALFFQNWLRVC